MNTINQTTVRQYKALATRTIKFNGKTFKFSSVMFDDKTNTCHFRYEGRKSRGAFMKNALSVSATYNKGSDLYDLVVTYLDGVTADLVDVVSLTDMFADSFGSVQDYI